MYQVGKGEQGVLTSEPYKSELLPLWRFRTPEIAFRSSRALYRQYLQYRREGDYVGMDMTRKFCQMGWTRARRYANHKSGRKYDGPVPRHLRGVSGAHGREILPLDVDPVKAECAAIFRKILDKILRDPYYQEAVKQLRLNYRRRQSQKAPKSSVINSGCSRSLASASRLKSSSRTRTSFNAPTKTSTRISR